MKNSMKLKNLKLSLLIKIIGLVFFCTSCNSNTSLEEVNETPSSDVFSSPIYCIGFMYLGSEHFQTSDGLFFEMDLILTTCDTSFQLPIERQEPLFLKHQTIDFRDTLIEFYLRRERILKHRTAHLGCDYAIELEFSQIHNINENDSLLVIDFYKNLFLQHKFNFYNSNGDRVIVVDSVVTNGLFINQNRGN